MGDSPKTDTALTGGSLENPEHSPAESGVDEGARAYDGDGGTTPGSGKADTTRDHPDTVGRGGAGGNG